MNSHPGPKIIGNGKRLRRIKYRNQIYEFDKNGKIIDPSLREIIQTRAPRTFYPREALQQDTNTNTNTNTNSENESDDNIFEFSSPESITWYPDDSPNEFGSFPQSDLSDDSFPEYPFIKNFGMHPQFEQMQIPVIF